MSQDTPLARASARFGNAATVAQIEAAAGAVCESNRAHLVAERRYDDGDVLVLGQTSRYPFQQLIITTPDGGPLRHDATYSEVKVASHKWPGPVYLVGYGDEQVIAAVKEFTAALQAKLSE